MEEKRKVCMIINAVSVAVIIAIAILSFYLEMNNLDAYIEETGKNEEAAKVIGIILLGIIACIPLAVSAVVTLISFIGLVRPNKTKVFMTMGAVGKIIAAAALVLYTVLLFSGEVPGILSKVLYLVIAFGFAICSVFDIITVKKDKNEEENGL